MIDFIRQREVIDRDAITDRVHVIGAGATGSWAVLLLAKLGIKNIHVYDFDEIEAHNLPNQMFGPKHIGMNKAEAIKEIAEFFTDVEVTAHTEAVDGDTVLDGIVFVMTDTMHSRKEIFEEAIMFKPQVKYMIETRMGYNSGRVYNINPMSVNHVNTYKGTLYSDESADEAGPSACGASSTIVATALNIVSIALWGMINFYNEQDNNNEILIDCEYNNLIAQEYEEW